MLWQALTHTGNQEFNDRNFEFALGHYEQALKFSSSMLNNKQTQDTEHILSLILISHCNLANCYFELNWIKNGCEQFEIAYQFLKAAIVLSNNNQLQLAALKSNKLLKKKWVASLNTYQNKLPDFNMLHRYSKSICKAYNIHTVKQIGIKNEVLPNIISPYSSHV